MNDDDATCVFRCFSRRYVRELRLREAVLARIARCKSKYIHCNCRIIFRMRGRLRAKGNSQKVLTYSLVNIRCGANQIWEFSNAKKMMKHRIWSIMTMAPRFMKIVDNVLSRFSVLSDYP